MMRYQIKGLKLDNDEFFVPLGMLIAGFFLVIMGIISISIHLGGALIVLIIGGVLLVSSFLKLQSISLGIII